MAMRDRIAVVHHVGPVVNPDVQITGLVVMQAVAGHTGTLRHPVQPYPVETRPIDAIATDDCVDRGVQLDARHLVPSEEPVEINVMYDGPCHLTGNHPQSLLNTRLFAVRDVVVADDVTADGLTVPPISQGALNRPVVGARRRGHIVELVAVLTQLAPDTSGVADVSS